MVSLDARSNRLARLPANVGVMGALVELLLDHNHLHDFPR